MNHPASPIRRITGAFRLLRKHARELAVLGLVGYCDAGERAATEVIDTVGTAARANHADQAHVANDLRDILADGHVCPAELQRLQRHTSTIAQCAQRSAGIVQTVTI